MVELITPNIPMDEDETEVKVAEVTYRTPDGEDTTAYTRRMRSLPNYLEFYVGNAEYPTQVPHTRVKLIEYEHQPMKMWSPDEYEKRTRRAAESEGSA